MILTSIGAELAEGQFLPPSWVRNSEPDSRARVKRVAKVLLDQKLWADVENVGLLDMKKDGVSDETLKSGRYIKFYSLGDICCIFDAGMNEGKIGGH